MSVRVRFAPSPTGYVHIGSLRTALFNYLFAKHNNGKFIIRVEDTDQARKVEGAVENMLNSLKLLGIDYDEGPFKEGNFGPYFQSQRLEIYKKYCDELLAKGAAYYAFETPEEIEEMRKLQQLEGRQTMYDRRARSLTTDEVNDKLSQKMPHVIRLKVPLDDEVKFDDLIKGIIKIDTNIIDDQILIKSDGYPTYHLANVVDDHLMNITHIIRGEEWITSVPKHIIIYNALGWDIPTLAHVPLILNSDKSKLSKRQGDVAVEDYLRKGYLKEALVNFIALLGWNPGEGETEEFFSMEELIKLFNIEKVQKSGAIFNVEKLDWMNNHYIKNYDLDELTDLSIPYFKQAGFEIHDREFIKKILNVVRVYLNKLSDIPEHLNLFLNIEVKLENDRYKDLYLNTDSSQLVFNKLIERLEVLNEITIENYKQSVKEVQNETGIKGKNLFKPLRIAITGSESGPELPAIAEILGKDKVIRFLKSWLE